MSIKFNDTQLVLLSDASQRDDHCLVPPAGAKRGRAQRAVAKLLEAGLLKEIRAKAGAPIWRRDDETGQTYALKLTVAGAKAIAVDEATASESIGERRADHPIVSVNPKPELGSGAASTIAAAIDKPMRPQHGDLLGLSRRRHPQVRPRLCPCAGEIAAGKRGMAATSHPTATFAAVEALRDGGNAIDAAVAACAVQCVVEAGSTGIGGDCFALLSRGGSADVIAYNGSGRTPAAATAEWYERHGVESIERHSPHAVTIPGAVERRSHWSIVFCSNPSSSSERSGSGVEERGQAAPDEAVSLPQKGIF